MKKIFLPILATITLLVGCKTDHSANPHVDIQAASAPVITPMTMNVLELSKDLQAALISFSWNAADYGFAAAVNYSIEIDVVGNGFAKPVQLITTSTLSASLTVAKFNDAVVNKLKLMPDEIGRIEMRVGSSVTQATGEVFSAPVTILVLPYQSNVVYPFLSMPGNYQGWAPDKVSTRIYSAGLNQKYEGYMNMVDGSGNLEFKFVDGTTWSDPGYAGAANATATGYTGVLVTPSNDNIMGAKSGYYRVNVDLEALTFDLTTITTWGIIGDATPAGWGASTPLVFNAEENLWTLDVTMGEGSFKLRANNDWTIQFGAGDAPGILGHGDNIPGPGAGNYTLKVNLAGPIYTYEFIPR